MAAEGLNGAAGVCFDDEGVCGVAYYHAETAIWGCGGAVYGAGEVVVRGEGVGFDIEGAKVVVVGGENAYWVAGGAVRDDVNVVGYAVGVAGDEAVDAGGGCWGCCAGDKGCGGVVAFGADGVFAGETAYD